jgi:hypothetical protein
MNQVGLMRDVPNGAPKLAGETLGLLAPLAGTKQGAQATAGLLNRYADNLAAPKRLNPQTGAIVWHGSPHKFDKFDSSKIGTGEGAQAYGHGLYLAESKDTGRSYANKLTQVDGRAISDQLDSRTRYLNMLKEQAASGDKNAAKNVPVIEKSIADLQDQGSLYKVDLPDEHIAKMLDWDKPLTPKAKKAINDVIYDNFGGGKTEAIGKKFDEVYKEISKRSKIDGRGVYTYLANETGGQAALSNALKEKGIPGIRYLDGGSRGAGAGSSNYVVFPGNEDLLRILERNGIPIK